MGSIRTAAGAAAVVLGISLPAGAGGYSSTIFFGDSLTDSGTFRSVVPTTGKFTTNPGPVWAETVAAFYGTGAVSAVSGGTNHAVGGARVAQLPGVPNAPPTATATPLATQITAYLAATGGTADAGALYTVWGGANDIFAALNTPATAQAAVGQAAADLVTQVARLRAAGARHILVPTVPDIGITPFGRAQGSAVAAQITQLVSGYNQIVMAGLSAAGGAAIPVDTFALLRAAVANPAAYGFANVTGTACTTSSSLLCSSATLAAPDAAESYLFADGVHPTTAGHRAIADYTLNVLSAPGNVARLADSPFNTRDRLTATIQAQAMNALWGRAAGTAGAWVLGGAGRLGTDREGARDTTRGTPLSVSVGIDKRFTDELLLGIAGTASTYRAAFSTGGAYTQREYVASVYGVYRLGGAYVGGVGSLGTADYDLRRGVTINGTDHATGGSTRGVSASVGADAGWDFTAGALTHGPVLGLRYQRVEVRGFSEDSALFGFRYERQTRTALIGSAGYRVAYDLGELLPYVRVTVNRDFRRGGRDITVSSLSVAAPSYTLPVAAPDRTYVDAAAGLSAVLAPSVTGTLGLNARLGQRHTRDFGAAAGVSLAF